MQETAAAGVGTIKLPRTSVEASAVPSSSDLRSVCAIFRIEASSFAS
jgi:hypothetical protein